MPTPDPAPGFVDRHPIDNKLDIPSVWAQHIPDTKTASVLTAPLRTQDVATQAVQPCQAGTQTDAATAADATTASASATDAALHAFLRRAGAVMLQELSQSQDDPDDARHGAQDDSALEPPECSYSLRMFAAGALSGEQHQQHATTKANRHRLVVTCLAWNKTGNTVAASYGRHDIDGWCPYPGALATWNLARGGLNPDKPDQTVDVDNCLMCCTFHPTVPSLIAGGSFNGEVYVWDLSREGDLQAGKSDSLSDMRHREPLVSLAWCYSLSEAGRHSDPARAYRLVSMSAEGRILVWLWHKLDHPVYGYELAWPQPASDRKLVWGATCLSFAQDKQRSQHQQQQQQSDGKQAAGSSGAGSSSSSSSSSSSFVAGTEGGKLFRCYLDYNDAAAKEFARALGAAGDGKVDLKSPIRASNFKGHAGTVNGVAHSPFEHDMLASCGSDGALCLHNALRQERLLLLQPCSCSLFGVQWSPARPLVLATSAGDGHVYLYDLQRPKDIIQPVLQLDAADGARMPCYAMAFNPVERRTFVCAAGDTVKVYKLPDRLVQQPRGEDKLLKKLLKADDAVSLLSRHSVFA